MNIFTKESTQDWWRSVLKDDAKLSSWLQKLYKTELGGYTEHLQFLSKEGSIKEKPAKIILNIALDELKHSHIISWLMEDRGIERGEPPESQYWKTVNGSVSSLEEYCAVNHFGEGLAAFRFEIIQEMPETPFDIKQALQRILPDEIFHRITLEKLAGEEALEKMRKIHENAALNLKSKGYPFVCTDPVR